MKPINLKIKGINSYVSEQEIDFAKLSESCLFGIFGETGSGKSTILDAIVIALYGSSDRDLNINLININSDSSLIEFVFEIQQKNESILYRVKRNFRVRTSGLKAEASLEDLTNRIMLADTVDATNTKLLSVVGIAKKEFLKCIALPQNEFDKFLMDIPSDRKKSIAKLFNLEQFGVKLNEKIKNRKNICENKKNILEEKLGVYKSFFTLNETELEKKQSEINKTLKVSEAELLIKEKAFTTNMIVYDNIVALSEIKTKLSELNIKRSIILKKQDLVVFSENYHLYDEFHTKLIAIESKINILKSEVNNVKCEKDCLETTITKDVKLLSCLDEKIEELNSEYIESIKLEQEKNSLNEKLSLAKREIEKVTAIKAKLFVRNKEIENELFQHKTQSGEVVKQLENKQENAREIEQQINVESKRDVYALKQEFKNYEQINLGDLKSINYSLLSKANIGVYENVLNSINNKLVCLNKDLADNKNLFGNTIKNETKDLNELYYFLRNINLEIKDISSKLNLIKFEIEKLMVELSANNETIKNNNNMQLENTNSADMLISKINKIIVKPAESVKTELENKTQEKVVLLNTIKLNEQKVSTQSTLLQMKNLQIENFSNEFEKLCLENKNKFAGVVSDKNKPLTTTEIELAKKEIEEFKNAQIYCSEELVRLESLVGTQIVNKEFLNISKAELQSLKENIRGLQSELVLTESELKQAKTNYEKQQELILELVTVNNELNVVHELALQVSNNSFMDFVSEEYLHLITDFSNKFVYKISQGKYFIEYDGNDFVVVDNFNGGNKRSVKTLSGGERFIMSLSLALGISQSIAANSNKSFNFFFIDEGFGNLSESYVNSVIACFDSLIKLNFTVGFISHVEKMQDFITNKIVVEKKSTEEGSVIHSYF